MNQNERLSHLLSYHHNLSIQLTAAQDGERNNLNYALGNLEQEIDHLLFNPVTVTPSPNCLVNQMKFEPQRL